MALNSGRLESSFDDRFGSIIVISHNYGRFLQRAIDSALGQVGVSHEVIVVDDGSTDDSRDLIASYGKRIIAVYKEAGGHVSAVNAGYAASLGKIVIFLDADDVLYDSCLDHVAKRWTPGIAKLQYRLDTIDEHGVNQHMPFPYFPADLTPAAVLDQARKFGMYPWTVSSGNAFGRHFLDQLLPIDNREIYRSPDGFLSKMAPLFGDVVSVPEILGAYRVHGNNAWAQSRTGFKVEPIIRWLSFDIVLQARFENLAASRQIAVTKDGNRNNTQHLEHRLLALRFGRQQSPYPSDAALTLIRAGARTVDEAPNMKMAGRLVWMSWFLVLAFMPKSILLRILARSRLQTGRSEISKFLVWLSRGSASG